MSKTAFIFPGQGAQYVGMGREISDNFKVACDVFDEANSSIKVDIKDICFNGPESELVKTENTQPAILTTSIAILRVLQDQGIKADVTAGLSLGEYSSLVYSGVMKFSQAVELVKKRGRYMQQAVPEGKGNMAAVLGLSREQIQEVIEESKSEGLVSAANFNCPGQIVLSGERAAIEKAIEVSKKKGAKRSILLPVSAPFHCEMLSPAGDLLFESLREMDLEEMTVPVISNVTGDYIESSSDIVDLLKRQVSSSVLWEDSVEKMLQSGVDTFVEIGPGKTLTAFVKKIAKNNNVKVNCLNVEDLESLKNTIEFFHKEG